MSEAQDPVAADRTAAAIKVIMDVDPGHDDAIALLLAAASPALSLQLVTVVAGNQTLDHTLENALAVLSAGGIRHVPVAGGMDRPLVRSRIVAPSIHGQTGLDGPPLPPITIKPNPRHGVDLLVSTLLESDGDMVLI